jgi:uncharacterized protein with HEPN domain
MKDEGLYILHILDCVKRIEEYTSGLRREDFEKSNLIQDAVIRNLQIMAESTQRLSTETKQRAPELEWAKIAGFRNILVHDYLGLDMRAVWNVVANDLSSLKESLEKLSKSRA